MFSFSGVFTVGNGGRPIWKELQADVPNGPSRLPEESRCRQPAPSCQSRAGFRNQRFLSRPRFGPSKFPHSRRKLERRILGYTVDSVQ